MSELLEKEMPKLGYGLMRMPMYGKSKTRIDVLQVKYMVDRYLEAGFNYFECSYADDGGLSEKAVRDALVERHPRERYLLASRLPVAAADDAAAAEHLLKTSLERCGVACFDLYLLAGLGGAGTEQAERGGLWEMLRAQKQAGLIRAGGISFRGAAAELDQLLAAHPEAEFVELELNYADWYAPGSETAACCAAARKHGRPVIAASPLRSGLLANPPYAAAGVLRDVDPLSSLSSWGLRFAASAEGVITVVANITNSAQMNDDIETLRSFRALSNAEKTALEQAGAAIAAEGQA